MTKLIASRPSAALLEKLVSFNEQFQATYTPTNVYLLDEITVKPDSSFRVRFTYGGGLRYYAPDQQLQILEPQAGAKYQVQFSVRGAEPWDQLARIHGQQMDWSEPCWPSLVSTLGQSVLPEAARYFPPDFPQGEPCTLFTCETWAHPAASVDQRKLSLSATHIEAKLDLARMMTTPLDSMELVFFLITTAPNTTATVVINQIK